MDLSIIIPVYNTEKYLKECLDSVLSKIKDKNNIEVILIDDGSTDHSSRIYRSYQQSNFIWFKDENHGVSHARNEGLKRATGTWVMFLDADDLLASNWNDTIKVELNSKDDIIYFFHKNPSIKVEKEDLLDNIIGLNQTFPYMTFPGARIFRRSFLRENKIFFQEDIIHGEDLLFNLEALLKTEHYHIVNKSIYWYRYNLSSSTKKFHKKIFVSDQRFQQELARICKKDTYQDFCLRNAIYTFLIRISYLETKRQYQENLGILEEEPYRTYLENASFDKKKSFGNLMVFLAKKKHYLLAIRLIQFRREIKNTFLMKKKEDILEEV